MRPEVPRSAQPDVHAQLRAADQERVAHVVAGVAQVAVGDPRERLGAVLGHGHDIGQDLRRVELVGQPVPDRHARVPRELLDDLLAEAAVLDAVVDAPEDPGRVLHGFLVPDLGPARPEVGHVGTLVVRGDLERDARPGRRLLEDEGDVPAAESLGLGPGRLGGLELGGQVQQEADLVGTEVEELQEAAVPQVDDHEVPPGFIDGRFRDVGTGAAIPVGRVSTPGAWRPSGSTGPTRPG